MGPRNDVGPAMSKLDLKMWCLSGSEVVRWSARRLREVGIWRAPFASLRARQHRRRVVEIVWCHGSRLTRVELP